jgi:hypothetical protein
MSKMKRLFKLYYVYPAFQTKFLGYFMGLFVLTSVCLYSAIYIFFSNLKASALALGVPKGHVFFLYTDNQQYDLNQFLIALLIINFLLLLIVGFVMSYKIARSLCKMESYLSTIQADSEDFKLPKKDFLEAMEVVVNNCKSKIQ